MANYNFHEKLDRYNTASVKWEMTKEVFGEKEILPMWVADMDFQPPKEVTDALKNRVEHGIYGYTFTPPSATEAVQSWLKKRHDWEVDSSSVIYSPGVVPSIGIAVNALTEPGDKVLMQSPVYPPFFNMVKNNDRVVVNSPLLLKEDRFEIDFADFEEKLKEGIKLFILCNPHNPGGRVWTEEELRKMADLCIKYDCLILSDEIHSDLIYSPNVHVPMVKLDQKYEDYIVTCIAPSKTFNIAGLQASAVIIPNEKLRVAFQKVQGRQGFHALNTFGVIGLEAAYRHGEEWLEQLLVYLSENVELSIKFIEEHIPNLSVMRPDGTYLLWIDCRKLGLSDAEIKEALLKKGRLGLEPGPKYGQGGEGFVRMNIACARDVLMDGLERLKKAFE